jgi:hypothetical protein
MHRSAGGAARAPRMWRGCRRAICAQNDCETRCITADYGSVSTPRLKARVASLALLDRHHCRITMTLARNMLAG